MQDIQQKQQQYHMLPYDTYLIILFDYYNINYKIENNKIQFEYNSLQTLNEYIQNNGKLKHNDILKLIYDTGILIKSLEEDNRGIFCFSINDYIVINKNLFLFINHLNISTIYKKNLTLTIPIDTNEYFIKNDLNFSHLPIKEYYTISYYHFGLMIIYLLTEERYSNEKIELLNKIYQTYNPSLYYFLLRCLNANPQERYYIYI